jgi:hypothetical protein
MGLAGRQRVARELTWARTAQRILERLAAGLGR